MEQYPDKTALERAKEKIAALNAELSEARAHAVAEAESRADLVRALAITEAALDEARVVAIRAEAELERAQGQRGAYRRARPAP
jgi:hypothetical protein